MQHQSSGSRTPTTAGVIKIWTTVDVDSVDLFKTRLDKFWTFQDVKYDYTVDLTGTGDRSEFDTENY